MSTKVTIGKYPSVPNTATMTVTTAPGHLGWTTQQNGASSLHAAGIDTTQWETRNAFLQQSFTDQVNTYYAATPDPWTWSYDATTNSYRMTYPDAKSVGCAGQQSGKSQGKNTPAHKEKRTMANASCNSGNIAKQFIVMPQGGYAEYFDTLDEAKVRAGVLAHSTENDVVIFKPVTKVSPKRDVVETAIEL